MNHPVSMRGLLALSLILGVLPALADDDCDAPMDRWQSREAVRQMAARQGWEIHRLKIDDGCYEVRATDAQGRSFKAKIDPETLKVLKMKPQDREPARVRNREHRASQARLPQPVDAAPSAPSPSPASAPGNAPRSRIE